MRGKRLISILLALVLVLSMIPVLTASAANYNIWVCGKTITDDNKGDVLGDGAVSFVPTGSVYYLYLKKSISWNNGSAMAAINSMLGAELRIVVTGDVSVERTMNGGAISHNNQLSITCDGTVSKLTAIGTGSNSNGAIYADGGISIKDAVVDASGGPYGIHAGGKLEITESTVSAKGTTSAIYGDGGLSLGSDMGVIIPEAGQIFGADIRNADGSRATEVLLAPVENFDLKVCGKQVNTANMEDILGDGVFSFDPEEKLLTINGDCEYMGNIIESRVRGLTVYPAKDVTLKAIDGHGIVTYGTEKGAHPSDRMALPDLWLTTEGSKLTMVCSLSCIFADNARARIFNSVLDLSGKNGIIGPGSSLNIDESTVSVKGSTAAVSGFDVLSLTGCYIKAPEGAEIADGGIKVDGALAKEVLIAPGELAETYDLTIDGKTVTSENCADVLGNGVFAYDPATVTLTISGDYSCSNVKEMEACIYSEIDDLTIRIEKDSRLSGTGMVLFSFTVDTTITGPGKLISPSSACDFNLNGFGAPATLTIEDANLELSNAIRGGEQQEKLVIKNSNVVFGAGSNVGVTGFGAGIELINCYIAKPDGATIKDGAIMVGSELAKVVEIKAGEPGGPTELKNPFVDVKESDYFYDAVLWAYYAKPQVTNGLDATHFGPAVTCTRGQIVTFLWRAHGEPAPTITKNPFEDVKESDYFYKAVLWAVEKGVTNGVDDTHFAPNANCKREHAVAFLYRAAGKPAYTAKDNPFVDVAKTAYYYDAVLWAVEKNITKGMDATHFGPAAACQRSQIVTFLYRFMNP